MTELDQGQPPTFGQLVAEVARVAARTELQEHMVHLAELWHTSGMGSEADLEDERQKVTLREAELADVVSKLDNAVLMGEISEKH